MAYVVPKFSLILPRTNQQCDITDQPSFISFATCMARPLIFKTEALHLFSMYSLLNIFYYEINGKHNMPRSTLAVTHDVLHY